MGYYSDFSGEFSAPNDITPEQEAEIVRLFKAKWGDYNEDADYPCHLKGTNYEGHIFYSVSTHSIHPVEYSMKGYDIEDELADILAEIDKVVGVKINGDMYVDGEESHDHCMMTVKDNVLYIRPGYVVYDEPTEPHKSH